MQDLVTVFGGSGFVGSQVVRALARAGHRVRVAVRQPGRAHDLLMLGDVGQIQVVQANIRDPDSVARALDGAQACVNLVGVLYESGRQKFASLHTEGAANVAQAAKAAGISRMVQVSSIGADAGSPSAYARTKAAGEAAVREALPQAVILRPSIVFGPEDDFFNRFAAMAVLSPALPLIGGGQTRFQPVFVGDVARAVAVALSDPACAGKTYELGGPAILTFRQLLELVLSETQRRRLLLPLPFPIANLIGQVGNLMALTPIAPPLTTDQVAQLKVDNVADKALPGLSDLGIEGTAVESVVGTYLYRYRKGGQFAETPEVDKGVTPT
ncbi:MAG: complex I NDUFA9 subunit family protein [Phenylobacterium sp.]|uniref:complex I NDUFA9 subunit family protein n=1 Tax=Phenylobacterium sp. TaxID=1871053 RepID=UPI0025DD9410|nr:complex I NDUFA9 subunit family protein [Phenylobacterium sp.]MCG9915542.1 complex I NDUFA9 subunit family protein [Phenylobacterium sp.]